MKLAGALDRAILALAPSWGLKRMRSRLQASAMGAAYEAAERSRLRTSARDYGSGNAAVQSSAAALRREARHLDRNLDLVDGGLNALSQNCIGATGIGVEPQPRGADGMVAEGLAQQILNLRRDWTRRPEVTWQHDWAQASRLGLRSWAVDGELLMHELLGSVPGLQHGTRVPYSVELIEADQLPLDFDDAARNIVQGVERDAWGRPVAYHLYKQHPGDTALMFEPALRRVSADRVRHIKNVRRLGQVRGVSMLASVLTRLDDLKDYEESERIAAKIAASFCAFIQKGDAQSLGDGAGDKRTIRIEPGMVFDDLRPGESIGMIDSSRPNANLEGWRAGQLRAVASGMRVSFSTLAKDYNGTYSSQRQELVEQYGAYGCIAWEWIAQAERPVYESLVYAALISRQLDLPAGFDLVGLYDAAFVPPSMPWINPRDEVEALSAMEDRCYMSGGEILRRRGANPQEVLDQQKAWLEQRRARGLDPVPAAGPAPAPAPAPATPAAQPAPATEESSDA